jgi:two-component system, NarL family, nitrate/nitrite response regulator NarL
MIDVVLADDHPIVLAGLENMLRRQRDCRVVASCVDGVEALRAINQYRPDVAVLDLRMPRMTGLAVLRQMQKDNLPTRPVVLAAVLDDDDLVEAIRLGVRGVLLKEMAAAAVVECIREVHAGGQWMEKRSVTHALDKMVRREQGARDLEKVLTTRELQIAGAVATGLRNKEIADKFGIAEGTVKIHLHVIYEKLKIDGRMALVLKMREKALI